MYRDLLIERWNPTVINIITGDVFWLNAKGKLHIEGDQPASIFSNGTMEWYKNGTIHRSGDKPAIIEVIEVASLCKIMEWFKNGNHHRDGDKPATIWSDGTMEWWENGIRHRSGDKPSITYTDGKMYWFKNGESYTPLKNK